MQRKLTKWPVRFGLLLLIFLIIFTLIIGLFRNNLLRIAANKAQEKAFLQYGVKVYINNISFAGLSQIEVKDLCALLDSDTLVNCNSISIKPNWAFLWSKANKLQKVSVNGLNFKLYLDKFTLAKNTQEENLKTNNITALVQKYAPKLNLLFTAFPQKFELKEASFQVKKNNQKITLECSNLSLEKDQLLINGTFSDDSTQVNYTANGVLSDKHFAVSCKFNSKNQNPPYIPLAWLKPKIGVQFASKNIHFELWPLEKIGEIVGIKSVIGFDTLIVDHWRIAANPVLFESIKINLKSEFDTIKAEILPNSKLEINGLSFDFSAKFNKSQTRQVSYTIQSDSLLAQDFFDGLPKIMFPKFENIKAEGKIAFYSKLFFDLDTKDTIDFETNLGCTNFSIIQWGKENPRRFNEDFVYFPFGSQRHIAVGEQNPNFTPLYQMSRFVPHTVICSEDGDFYYHNGFNLDAIRKSIIANAKAKRFVRGGSTISMQLAKNIILTREKNIARKLEEALWVWLIHNQKVLSKDRQLEIYLNIIEWGPDIYGIAEAANFYFKKKPTELSLSESIFLAMIIPNPKGFRWHFDNNGILKENRFNYFEKVASIMLRREYISEETLATLTPNIVLKGEAKKVFLPIEETGDDDWEETQE